jgi:hypothetical protein
MGLDFTQIEGSSLTRAPRGDQATLQVFPAPGDVISRVGLQGPEPHVERWPLADAAESIDELLGVVQKEVTWTT